MWKVVPCFSLLSTQMIPKWFSMTYLTMASPSPTPPKRRVLEPST